jgi:predicted transcriptional regulator
MAATKTAPAAKKTAKGKPAAKRRETGNLAFNDAVMAALSLLKKGRKTRTDMKAGAPYGNYTALCNYLSEEGLAKADKGEEDSQVHYEITAKGRNFKGVPEGK